MATYDDVASNEASNATSLTIPCTPVGTPTGVGVGFGTLDFDSRTLSSVTYGGTAMTLELSYNTANYDTWLYGLANPASGNQDLVITMSGATFRIKGAAITVTDGSTTDVFSNSSQDTGTGTAPSTICTSATGELVMDVCNSSDTGTRTAGAGQDNRYDSGISGNRVSVSTEAGASPNVTMSWTLPESKEWWIIAASFANAAAGGGKPYYYYQQQGGG